MTSSDGERLAPVTYLFGAQSGGERGAERVDSPSDSGSSLEWAASVPESESSAPWDSRQGDAGGEERTASRSERSSRSERGAFEPVSNASMHALARRGMSSEEMRQYLLGREFESSEVDAEITRLEGVELLDDAALAQTLVRTLRERKGLGRAALSAELRRRKLEGAAVEEALLALADDDEVHRATELALKRAPQLASLDHATAARRLGAFLMRKGYSGQAVSMAVAAALTPARGRGPVFR